ncbi:hypothetical protein GCM10027562_28220 [Arthrobacter pigmenti]
MSARGAHKVRTVSPTGGWNHNNVLPAASHDQPFTGVGQGERILKWDIPEAMAIGVA